MPHQPVVIERTFNTPADKVWMAITDNSQMKQWYFDLKEFKPEVGFQFRFNGGRDDKIYVHICKIVDVVEGKKLSYSWRYKGHPGISFVTFELFTEGNKTKLKLTHEGLETFPANNPDLAKENFAMGWTDIIGRSLKSFLEKQKQYPYITNTMEAKLKSKPQTVDEYIARQPKQAKTLLQEIRETIKKAAPGAEEIISYSMPAFKLNGMLVWYAAFKNHIGFYPRVSGMEAFKKELSVYKNAKGSVQFPIDEPMPLALVTKIVKYRVKENMEKAKSTAKKK